MRRHLAQEARLVLLCALLLVPAIAAGQVGALRDNPGFLKTVLVPTNPEIDGAVDYDDGSSEQVAIGFEVKFFGERRQSLFINVNGNVTFDAASGSFVPVISDTDRLIIAPFFADVDLTADPGELARVTYGTDQVGGRSAFGVNWLDVGHFRSKFDGRNTFQLVLIDRSDVAPGDFDIEFNFARIEWDVSDPVDDATPPARVGFSNGTRAPGAIFELDDAPVEGTWVDANAETGLVHGSRDSAVPGRYVLAVRNGAVTCKRDKECSDGIACTRGSCAPGIAGADRFGCVHVPSCTDADPQCTTCTVDLVQRQCVAEPRPDGTACDNGDDCSFVESGLETDVCDAGECESPSACLTTGLLVDPNESPARTIVTTCGTEDGFAEKGDKCVATGIFVGTETVAPLLRMPSSAAAKKKPITPGTVIYKTARVPLDPATGVGKRALKLKLNAKGKALFNQTSERVVVSVRVSTTSDGRKSGELARRLSVIGKRR